MIFFQAAFWFAVVICAGIGATVIFLGLADLRKAQYLRKWFRITCAIFGIAALLSLLMYPLVRAIQ